MRMHPGVTLPAIILALLLGMAQPSQAQKKPKGGEIARDFAQLMPADPIIYAEMDHPNMTKQFLAMIKGTALNDYGAFRDDLYKKHKLEAGDAGYFNFKLSAWLAFVLAPEFLDEIGRMKGHALAVTDIVEGKYGPEPKFLWVIDPGTSKIVPLIARDVVTLSPGMKSVRIVDGVRLYQNHHRAFEYDDKGMKKEPKEGKIEPSGPVLAMMPNLIVVGSDPNTVADVVLRAKGKKASAPALSELGEFKKVAHLRDKKQLFGFANLKKLYSKTGVLMHPGGLGTLFGFESTLFQLESLLGPESHKELAVAFWLENNDPHMDLTIHVNAEKTGPLAKLLSSRTIDPGVLHFAPASAYATMTVPLFKDPGDWPKLVTALQTAARKYSVRDRRHRFGPTQVSITPDGKHAVTLDDVVKLWDTEGGKEIEQINKRTYRFAGQVALAISPDGKRFVVVNNQNMQRPTIFDATNSQLLRSLGIAKKGAPGVTSVAFSPDGKRIVTGEGGFIKEWSADTGEELRSKKLHELENQFAQVTCVCFGPGYRIVSGGSDKLIKVLLADGKVLTLTGHEQGISAVSVSADGKRIVSGDYLGVVKVWDADKGAELFSFTGGKNRSLVRSVSISPNGLRIASSEEDYSRGEPSSPIMVRDLDKGKAKEAFTLKGHHAAVVSLVIAADGKSIVSGDMQGNLKVWNAIDGTETSRMPLSTLEIMAQRFSAALANPKGQEMIAGVNSATLAFAGKAPENAGPMVILAMRDPAAAKALVDMVPALVSQGQTAETKKFGKHTIHSLPEGKNYLEWPLSYGLEGNIVVFGSTPAGVADALQGGAARRGFAAQPDVAKTLAQLKDVNGLLLWSGRNILTGMLKADDAELQRAIKEGRDKPGKSTEFDRALMALYPQQMKKLGADFDKITADLPAGSLTVSAQSDKLTISGSQQGLKTILPRLLDAYVEWDLIRPSFSNLGHDHEKDEAKDEKIEPKEEKK